MNDRILLAEAMGDCPGAFNNWDEYKQAVEHHSGEALRILLTLIPDPYTSADDDYKVLEFMRERPLNIWHKFVAKLEAERKFDVPLHGSKFVWNYRKGDYARAAITVLKGMDDG